MVHFFNWDLQKPRLYYVLVYERKLKSEYLERQIYERFLRSEPSIVNFIENQSEHLSKLTLHHLRKRATRRSRRAREPGEKNSTAIYVIPCPTDCALVSSTYSGSSYATNRYMRVERPGPNTWTWDTGDIAKGTQPCPDLRMGRQFDRKHANKRNERTHSWVKKSPISVLL